MPRSLNLAMRLALLIGLLVEGVSLAQEVETEESRDQDHRGEMVLVVGASGTAEFGEQFAESAKLWLKGAESGGLRIYQIGISADEDTSDREQLQNTISSLDPKSPLPLWIVLIGHGTFDSRTAKFNLRGEDVSTDELQDWLKPVERPVAIVAGFSASAPFLESLSAEDRVIVSATKSGAEVNFSRFGGFLAQTVVDIRNDLDKDGQVSLLEGFLAAARKTQEFYDGEGRLATEHPLLDDNGDKLGTRAEAYRGIRLIEKDPNVAWDGLRAHQWHLIPSSEERRLPAELSARRDELELAIARLRDLKSTLPEDVYYRELESLLIEMAGIYATLDNPETESGEVKPSIGL